MATNETISREEEARLGRAAFAAALADLGLPSTMTHEIVDLGTNALDQALASVHRVVESGTTGTRSAIMVCATYLMAEFAYEAMRDIMDATLATERSLPSGSGTPHFFVIATLCGRARDSGRIFDDAIKLRIAERLASYISTDDAMEIVGGRDTCDCEVCTLQRKATAEVRETGEISPATRAEMIAYLASREAAKETIQ